MAGPTPGGDKPTRLSAPGVGGPPTGEVRQRASVGVAGYTLVNRESWRREDEATAEGRRSPGVTERGRGDA